MLARKGGSLPSIAAKKSTNGPRASKGTQKQAPETIALGRRLQERREEVGLTRQELADIIGGSASNIERIEEGRGGTPAHTLRQLAEGVETTPRWLKTEKGLRHAPPTREFSRRLRALEDAVETHRDQLIRFADFLGTVSSGAGRAEVAQAAREAVKALVDDPPRPERLRGRSL